MTQQAANNDYSISTSKPDEAYSTMKTPYEVVPFTWPTDQLGMIDPHPRPYIARGQQVWAIYNTKTGQFYRWAYPQARIAEEVAKNLVQAVAEDKVLNFDMTPREVVIPRIFANLTDLVPFEPVATDKPTIEVIYLNH